MVYRILITGGSGYIGSNLAVYLAKKGFSISVVDKNPSSNEAYLNSLGIKVITGDITKYEEVYEFTRNFDLAVHLAALKSVVESEKSPEDYYLCNVVGTLNLVRALVAHGRAPLIFSSTAAVYSNSVQSVLAEEAVTTPSSVYGRTKLNGEELLRAICGSNSMSLTIFRLFNVAGVLYSELPDKSATNIFPILFDKAIGNEEFSIFGDDHLTPDGTCVRDYIHIADLIEAFSLEIEKLLLNNNTPQHSTFNLGSGKGSSVHQVLSVFEELSGYSILRKVQPKRFAENAFSIADIRKIESRLGWKPTRNLQDIVHSAWKVRGMKDFD